MAQESKSCLVEEEDPFILHSQHHCYWCPGDARSQDISSHGTDLVWPECSGFINRRVKLKASSSHSSAKQGISWMQHSRQSPEYLNTRAQIQYKDHISRYGNSHYKDKMRPSYFIMGIPMLVRQHLYIESVLSTFFSNNQMTEYRWYSKEHY